MSGEQKTIDDLKKQNARLQENCEVSAQMINNLANELTRLENQNAGLKLENAALKAALNECRAWLDNCLNDMEENGESPGSWAVIQTKALFDKCDKLLNKQPQPESDKTE